MLMANPETGAPDITCRLDLRGPHAISIGIHPQRRCGASRHSCQIDWHNATGDVVWLRARLTGDQRPWISVLEWDPGGHTSRRPERPTSLAGWTPGPHAISIGIHPSDIGQIDWHNATVVWLRASSPAINPSPSSNGTPADTSSAAAWRRSSGRWPISDQEITFSQYGLRAGTGAHPELGDHAPARIAYIKLVPLTDEEAEIVRADRADRSNKRLQGHTDISNVLRAGTLDAIRQELESYRDSDFDRIHWELGSGDLMNYPSRIGRTLDQIEPPDYGRKWDRYLHEGWNRLITAGIDPFGEAVSYAHGMGMGFHAAYRLAGWTYPPPLLDYAFADGLYDRHPEWRCKDRDGRDQARLSYAFPEVQEYCISVLREVVRAYPVDGITLLYNRRPPYLDYEAPLTEGFKSATGRDPFQIPADDPEWLRYRADALTAFMRRVRHAMAAEADARGAPIEISACILGAIQDNLFFGIDVAAWAREGLVDTVMPYSSAPYALPVPTDTWSGPEQVRPFAHAVAGTGCRLAMNIMPRFMPPEEFRRMAKMLYDAGSECLFFWDSYQRDHHRGYWNALRRLGHREEIDRWHTAGEPALGTPLTERELKERCAQLHDIRPEVLEQDRAIQPLLTLAGWNMHGVAPG